MSTDKTIEPIRKRLPRGLRVLQALLAATASGSTAIEFTLLSIPFAVLVFAILESCISFAGQQVMANVTDDIARQLRTGQLSRPTSPRPA